MAWEPCSDCAIRLDQRKKGLSKQEHSAGFTMLEVLKDIKDAPMPGNWTRVTSYECQQCGLRWTRTEGASGALRQYDSILSPKPTSDQESAL